MSAVSKSEIDVSRVFLAFLALQGDVRRTALALGMEDSDVAALAVQEKWTDKISNFAALRDSDSKVQIQINRAMGFVQACQLSTIVDSLIKEFSDAERMMDLLTTKSKFGSSFSTKAVVDLVRAAEVIQKMKAIALGDHQTLPEEEKVSGASIGLNVARALSAVHENKGVDAVTIVQKNLGGAV
jgi:hypothetical protein